MLEILGDRKICVARELSKIHEEITRGTISEVLSSDIVEKGEFVLFVEGNTETYDYSDVSIVEHVKIYVSDGYTEKEAIKLVAKDRNVRKSDIDKEYQIGK